MHRQIINNKDMILNNKVVMGDPIIIFLNQEAGTQGEVTFIIIEEWDCAVPEQSFIWNRLGVAGFLRGSVRQKICRPFFSPTPMVHSLRGYARGKCTSLSCHMD